MPQNGFFRLPASRYRLWAVYGSLGLGAIGILLGLSITAAFFESGNFLSVPGRFFVNSYGFLAYIIPAYLLSAAFLLADPRYRPERVFLLYCSIVPFLTLAVGFYWIRDYEKLALESSFISRAGKFGIGFLVFFLAALELLIIIFLRFLLFLRKSESAKNDSFKTGQIKAGQIENEALDTAPKENKDDQATKRKAQSLRDIYAESAAAMSAAEHDYTAVPVTALAEAPESILKPDEAPEEAIPEEPGNDVVSDIEELSEADEIPEGDDAAGSDDLVESDEAAENDEDAKGDEDVEKALAEAAAYGEVISGGGTGRRGEKKNGAADASGKKASSNQKGSGRKQRFPYFVPVEGILKQYPDGEYWIIDEDTRNAALTLKETFKEFNIHVEVTGIRKGPVITMFEILPAPGIRLTKIENLADNIALRLAAQSVRIVAPIPGKHAVGVEVPNAKRNIVSFREIIEGEVRSDGKKFEVPVVLGKDITGEAVTVDLVQMPHLLIAGATGSGKSVCVNSMILTILYQKAPAECRLILIDPKIVELKLYNDIPHLLTPVITEPKRAFQALQYCICEMERRYACLDSMGVRDIRSYNRRIKERNIAAEHLPYIVVVIDEFADLMATTGKELESTVARLAAMSRAVGIHLVLATQRPSIDVITGLIKANIPSRIAFMVASKMDSRIIIDMVGAEKLLGKGDMLYAGVVDPFPIRMQGAFISEEEVERVVDYVKSLGEPDYIDDEIFYDDDEEDADPSLFSDGDDPLYEKALEIVMQQGKASASYIQRRLKIGYNRAARLVEQMEHQGVVGPAQGSKPRELLRGL